MAWGSRIAVGMVLAEKGVVCVMFSAQGSTFIPNNTASGGTMAKATQGLSTLTNELAEHSGIDDAFADWLEGWFGKWEGMVASVLTPGVLMAVRCCIVPCGRGLRRRLIEAAPNKWP